jgi:hypothetical protein
MVKFSTSRGASVVLVNDKGAISASVNNGAMTLPSVELINDAAHGLCVFSRWGREVKIPVPAEAQAEVSQLFADAAAAVAASAEADKVAEAHAERVRRAMEG